MSALGQKRTSQRRGGLVRSVPKADARDAGFEAPGLSLNRQGEISL
jgi:hypothetical protein